jgi:hypothetical protein
MERIRLLSEIDGERLLVFCNKCGLVSNLSVSAIIGSYGEITSDTLIEVLAQRCSRSGSGGTNNACEMSFRSVEQRIRA